MNQLGQNVKDGIERFAKAFNEGELTELLRRYPDFPNAEEYVRVRIHYADKYARVDTGTSGRFLVELSTGDVFGIKAYGRPHRKHRFGNVIETTDWEPAPWAPKPKGVS